MLCGACVSINGVMSIFSSLFFFVCFLYVVRLQDSKLVVLIIFIIIIIRNREQPFVFFNHNHTTTLLHCKPKPQNDMKHLILTNGSPQLPLFPSLIHHYPYMVCILFDNYLHINGFRLSCNSRAMQLSPLDVEWKSIGMISLSLYLSLHCPWSTSKRDSFFVCIRYLHQLGLAI